MSCSETCDESFLVRGAEMNLKLEELRRRLLEPIPAPPAPATTVYKRSSSELYNANALRNNNQGEAAPEAKTEQPSVVADPDPAQRADSITSAVLQYVENTAASGSEEESMDQNSQYQLAQAVARVFEQTRTFQDRFGELTRMFDPIERLGQATSKALGPLRLFEQQLSQLATSFEPMRAFQTQLAHLAQSFEPMKGLQQQLAQLSEAFQAHLSQLVKSLEPAREFQTQLLKVARLFDSAAELQRDFVALSETFKGGPLGNQATADGISSQAAAIQH
jgi:hypothetical protein